MSTFKEYNCKDAFATYHASLSLQTDLKASNLAELYAQIVHPLADLICKINLRGLYVNVEAQNQAILSLEKEITQLQSDLNEIAGKEINVGGDSLKSWLFEDIGIKCTKKTKTGKAKVDEDALRSLKYPELAEVVELILGIRSKKKLKKTFLEGFAPDVETGRTYTNYRIGPATGRLSCKKPNLQNVPEGIARSVFCAPLGKKLVYADFSQLELRILAVLAYDRPLLQTFEEGKDIHDANARDLFSKKAGEEVTSRERYFAKTFIYGLNYGGSIETIRGRGSEVFHDISEKLMHEAAARYFTAHPAIAVYRKELENELEAKKRLVNAFGRPRVFFSRPKDALRQGYNFPMQSGAADIVNIKMLQIERDIPGALLLQVHDSIMLEVPEGEAEKVAQKVKEILEEPVKEFGGYSFPAKVLIGDNWSSF